MMVPFNDLKPRFALHRGEFEAAVARVFARGWYVLGPELEAFESEFSDWQGGGTTVGVANGTDSIELSLRAADIGEGDEVITVAHTAMATITAIDRAGAIPVLVDIDPVTCTIDPAAAEAAITVRTRAIVAVHIYGHPANMDELVRIARKHDLLLIEDCAQAHGAMYKGQKVGTIGDIASFSFYPTKNLGAFGDGGAVFTRQAALAAKVKLLRNYGQAKRYHHDHAGVNSRLDEMQAALLRVGLAHLDSHNDARRAIADQYAAGLTGVALPPSYPDSDEVHHVYHLYVVRSPQRDRLMSHLESRGVGTLIHYPIPNHLQKACAWLGMKPGSLPVTERVASEIVSLPMYVGLTPESVDRVIRAVSTHTLREAA